MSQLAASHDRGLRRKHRDCCASVLLGAQRKANVHLLSEDRWRLESAGAMPPNRVARIDSCEYSNFSSFGHRLRRKLATTLEAVHGRLGHTSGPGGLRPGSCVRREKTCLCFGPIPDIRLEAWRERGATSDDVEGLGDLRTRKGVSRLACWDGDKDRPGPSSCGIADTASSLEDEPP